MASILNSSVASTAGKLIGIDSSETMFLLPKDMLLNRQLMWKNLLDKYEEMEKNNLNQESICINELCNNEIETAASTCNEEESQIETTASTCNEEESQNPEVSWEERPKYRKTKDSVQYWVNTASNNGLDEIVFIKQPVKQCLEDLLDKKTPSSTTEKNVGDCDKRPVQTKEILLLSDSKASMSNPENSITSRKEKLWPCVNDSKASGKEKELENLYISRAVRKGNLSRDRGAQITRTERNMKNCDLSPALRKEDHLNVDKRIPLSIEGEILENYNNSTRLREEKLTFEDEESSVYVREEVTENGEKNQALKLEVLSHDKVRYLITKQEYHMVGNSRKPASTREQLCDQNPTSKSRVCHIENEGRENLASECVSFPTLDEDCVVPSIDDSSVIIYPLLSHKYENLLPQIQKKFKNPEEDYIKGKGGSSPLVMQNEDRMAHGCYFSDQRKRKSVFTDTEKRNKRCKQDASNNGREDSSEIKNMLTRWNRSKKTSWHDENEDNILYEGAKPKEVNVLTKREREKSLKSSIGSRHDKKCIIMEDDENPKEKNVLTRRKMGIETSNTSVGSRYNENDKIESDEKTENKNVLIKTKRTRKTSDHLIRSGCTKNEDGMKNKIDKILRRNHCHKIPLVQLTRISECGPDKSAAQPLKNKQNLCFLKAKGGNADKSTGNTSESSSHSIKIQTVLLNGRRSPRQRLVHHEKGQEIRDDDSLFGSQTEAEFTTVNDKRTDRLVNEEEIMNDDIFFYKTPKHSSSHQGKVEKVIDHICDNENSTRSNRDALKNSVKPMGFENENIVNSDSDTDESSIGIEDLFTDSYRQLFFLSDGNGRRRTSRQASLKRTGDRR